MAKSAGGATVIPIIASSLPAKMVKPVVPARPMKR